MNNYLEIFRSARRAAVPLIAIRNPDYMSVVKQITDTYFEIQKAKNAPEIPILQWDISRGVCGVNIAGQEAAALVNRNDDNLPPAQVTSSPVDALQRALEFMPQNSILFFLNGHLLLEANDPMQRLPAVQCIWNLRDEFKSTKRTLVILCPDIKLPTELRNDTVILDVALPDDAELEAIVVSQLQAIGKSPKANLIRNAVNAVSGLSAFIAENSVAMAFDKSGTLNVAELWNSKVKAIEQTAGLTVSRDQSSFDRIGGLDQAKAYLMRTIRGKRKPRLVVLIDEIGDQMSGRNDSNGLNADAQAQMLTCMEDYKWRGVLFHGYAGTGKTELGKAMGCEAGGLFLAFDMGAMKGGLVGDSERMIRAAMKILWAMGGNEVFFIGTTNSTASLTPQIKRRFGATFFFDLLSEAEQAPIWDIYKQRFSLPDQELPPCKGWTGAEIKRTCELADEFGVSLIEAAQFISPVADAMGEEVKAMRATAQGKCLSASYAGYYKSKSPITVKDVIENQKNN